MENCAESEGLDRRGNVVEPTAQALRTVRPAHHRRASNSALTRLHRWTPGQSRGEVL